MDGDEDVLLYGPPQYSPSRIAPRVRFIIIIHFKHLGFFIIIFFNVKQEDNMDISTENLSASIETVTNGSEFTENNFNYSDNKPNDGESSTSISRTDQKDTVS